MASTQRDLHHPAPPSPPPPPPPLPARVRGLWRRPFLLSAAGLRHALGAEVVSLLHMLHATRPVSRRLLRLFSGLVQGITVSHQQFTDSLYNQKRILFQYWSKVIFLFCLGLCALCYAVSNSSLSWQDILPLYNSRAYQLPAYKVHPKHIKLRGIDYTTHPPGAFPGETSTEPPGTTQGQYHQAYARNYHYLMDNPEVCKTTKPFLVLMVPVAPHNVAARDAIRQTWGNSSVVQGEVVLTMFMLGLSGGADNKEQQEKLNQENLQHKDLIQSNFMDTYLNLTIKTMVIMDWLATRCPTASYAMKIDSDMFLNIDNLVIMLKKPGIPKQNYLTGMLMWDRPVVRSKDSKWYVSEELYPDPRYPTYTLGMGYVFSNDLPAKYVEISKSIKPFNIEDAYIGMCMKKLGLAPTSAPDPSQFKAYNSRYDRCEFSKIITYILGSSQQLINYWTDLKKPGAPC
ncbi:hypothetical protein INR49_031658 [Caranx melampygus]|nr:hypothetical protein INR49_031658 [Caranx melampygus]